MTKYLNDQYSWSHSALFKINLIDLLYNTIYTLTRVFNWKE